MTSRTIVVGDLHGCYDETLALLSHLGVGSNDRLIFVGDLVDRGPKPRECVELAMRHECVLGNHEERHLQQRKKPPSVLSDSHRFTREQLNERHLDYFATLPHFLRLADFNAAVVHAGAYPGTPLEQQNPHHLLHIQNIKPPHAKSYWPSKAPDGFTFWANHWAGPERLIFGHTVVSKPLLLTNAVAIDTGAVFGRGLTALVLPDWELVTVPSKTHVSRSDGIAQYPLVGDVCAFS